MNHKQWYKDTFDQFELSEEALGKVKNMNMNSKKRHLKTGVRAAAAAVAVVMVFALGNAAVYAATGTSPAGKVAEQVVERVTVLINGIKADDDDVKRYVDKNGDTHVDLTIEDGSHSEIIYDGDALKENHISISSDSSTAKGGDEDSAETVMTLIGAKLKKEGNKVFLIVGNDEASVDITKDFADGRAEGKVKIDGKKYKYCVTGTIDQYDVTVS